MQNDRIKLSVVIPCYNSELFLEKTVAEVEDAIKDISHEIILIDDSSSDSTYKIIEKLTGEYKNITGINMARNFGQHAALMAGFSYVSGEIILCMDDDGQTPASEIHKLIDALSEDVDVVYAEYETKKHAWYRNLGSRLNAKMTEWLLDKPKDLYVSSFFVAKRYVIKEVLKYRHSFPYIIGLVLRTTRNVSNVTVKHKEREMGTSGYSINKLIGLWMNGFTAFSIKPLRIADFLGAIFAFIGFFSAIVLIIRRIIIGYSAVEGWYSLIAVILLVGGLLMLVLGMTGEYIGRAYLCINEAPQYVIRKECSSK